MHSPGMVRLPGHFKGESAMVDRSEIYAAIDTEREYQDGWRDPSLTTSGGWHSLAEFLVYIQDYTSEALHMATRRPDLEAEEFTRHQMRKIAALAVAAMEQHGVRYRSLSDNLKARHTQ